MPRRLALALAVALLSAVTAAAQAPENPEARFRRLAARPSEQRLEGSLEAAPPQNQALALLDGFVLEGLNAAPELDLRALNERLAALVTRRPSIGEGYQVFCLDGPSAAFALLVNFGLSGPSAVRIYTGGNGQYRLAARTDRFAQPDFMDDYLALVPMPNSPGVFLTVAGRTDELHTGSFTAWRFDGERIQELWTSDILPQSSYEVGPDGFRLTYCAESDDQQPQVCRRRARDRYVWDGAAWKRMARENLPASHKQSLANPACFRLCCIQKTWKGQRATG